MTAKSFISSLAAVAIVLIVGTSSAIGAQTATSSLGTVRLTRSVMANGQALPAGTYSLRLSNEPVAPVVGLSPEGARWVEFVQAGQVKGRELAVVVSTAEAREISDGAVRTSPVPRVQTLKGGDYMRVWVSQGGTHYLVHLSAAL